MSDNDEDLFEQVACDNEPTFSTSLTAQGFHLEAEKVRWFYDETGNDQEDSNTIHWKPLKGADSITQLRISSSQNIKI